jgi:hypothetical protein
VNALIKHTFHPPLGKENERDDAEDDDFENRSICVTAYVI